MSDEHTVKSDAPGEYVWKPCDRVDHEAGHPSGYDCDGFAIMPPHEVCGHIFPAEGHVHRCASEAYLHHTASRYCLCTCGERFDATTVTPPERCCEYAPTSGPCPAHDIPPEKSAAQDE
jgi:hypothetical protein